MTKTKTIPQEVLLQTRVAKNIAQHVESLAKKDGDTVAGWLRRHFQALFEQSAQTPHTTKLMWDVVNASHNKVFAPKENGYQKDPFQCAEPGLLARAVDMKIHALSICAPTEDLKTWRMVVLTIQTSAFSNLNTLPFWCPDSAEDSMGWTTCRWEFETPIHLPATPLPPATPPDFFRLHRNSALPAPTGDLRICLTCEEC